MGEVLTGAYYEMPAATDRSALVESIEPTWDLEVKESRPFNSSSVKKDPGMRNNSFQATIVDDSSLTFAQYLNTNQATKVTFVLRKSSAAIGATNPEWTGTLIVPPTMPPITQGELTRYTVTFQVDGAVAMATS